MFCKPGRDGVSEEVLSDQGSADNVGVREGCKRVCDKVVEISGFVDSDLKEW